MPDRSETRESYDRIKERFARERDLRLQRRQDGNYNGSYAQYMAYVKDVGDRMEDHFLFTGD